MESVIGWYQDNKINKISKIGASQRAKDRKNKDFELF